VTSNLLALHNAPANIVPACVGHGLLLPLGRHCARDRGGDQRCVPGVIEARRDQPLHAEIAHVAESSSRGRAATWASFDHLVGAGQSCGLSEAGASGRGD
jgi:hypothetical protein